METHSFLLEDYKQKVGYLTSHFTRMWTRFNFFMTIESALFTFSMNSAYADYAELLAVAGLILSLAWYFFGATDNYLVDTYRRQIGHAHSLLAKTLEKGSLEELVGKEGLEVYSYVGDVKDKSFNPKNNWVETTPKNFFQFRVEKISATELAVVFPTAFFVLWLLRIWY